MKTAQYIRQEKVIHTADSSGIRERWLWGLRLLRDPEAMTDSGKSLRHGVAERLIADADRAGQALTEREIQRRVQCARAYPKESQIRRATDGFPSWTALHEASFPPYDAPEDEPDFDYRSTTERRRAANRDQAADAYAGMQLDLFPLDQFEPTEATVKDLTDYAREQLEMTERFLARDRRRMEYVEQLAEAADGDLSMTWQVAHDRGVELGTITGEPTGAVS